MGMRHLTDTRFKSWKKTRRSWRINWHRHPSYNELFAKLQSRSNESKEDDDVDYEEIDDDVFEDEKSCQSTTVSLKSNYHVLYRRLLSLISLRKIWDLLVQYIWTSHRNRSGTQSTTPTRKVVEIEDVPPPENELYMLESDSESEDLFQDCEQDETKDIENVDFCFSPPAPSFVEALNRPFSSLFLRHEVIFTPQPATPLVFTPATLPTGSSNQSSMSNRLRLADLCWDNYELTTIPADDGNVIGCERWSVLPRSQRMPTASCLKMLWNLDSPSITEDVDEDGHGTGHQPSTNSLPVISQDPVSGNEELPKGNYSEGLSKLLEGKSNGTSQIKDCNDNVLN
ncbi:uncharacterized protein LOC130688807 [Daphnia carinata]|uniref:uncharacterized protein LOC130688807 n=1 Tax=Daphnia carinata TaxID=120202 RepID=UPI00257A88D2|nr:uncharacterized protein LOC130688807 [Daphnia carinata]